MSRARRLLHSRGLWVLGGVAVLVVLLAVAVSLGAGALAAILAGVVGLLVLGLGVLAVALVRARRRTNEVEQAVTARADARRLTPPPDRRSQVEDLERAFAVGIDALERSKIGRTRGARAARAALPWYLVIGPSGSGKTTALAASGLRFSLEASEGMEAGGTRACRWFFADHAVLLDTAGRYVTDDEADAWGALLAALRRSRPATPLNGVVLAISAADLIGNDRARLDECARQMRRRIDEVVDRLAVRPPVYLVVTQCDRLPGFVEFFEGLTPDERRAVWGRTFDLGDDRPASARIADALSDMHAGLIGRRIRRLRDAAPGAERRRVYAFPDAFQAAGAALRRFVGPLALPNPYHERPVWRGVYFTSAAQGGAGEAPAGADPGAALALRRGPRSFFLHDLLARVVVADRSLVRPTADTVRRSRLLQAGAGVALLALLTALVVGASSELASAEEELASVREAAVAAAGAPWQAPDEALARVDRLRRTAEAVAERAGASPFPGWGLRRGEAVLGPARRVHRQSVRAFVAADPLRVIRGGLREAVGGGGAGEALRREARTALYRDLKAYMLLTTQADRLADPVEQRFLAHHLATRAQVVRLTPPDARDDVFERVRVQVETYAGDLGAGRLAPFAADTAHVARVRTLVYEPPSLDRLYERIRAEAEAQLPALSLPALLGGRAASAFATRPAVPGAFTREGWEAVVAPAIAEETAGPDRVDWVLGHQAEDLPAALQDGDRVAAGLRERYFAEYAAAWTDFLRALRPRPFRSAGEAGRALAGFGSPFDSPLLGVLAAVDEQTAFAEGAKAGGPAKQAAEAGAAAAERVAARRLGRAGRALAQGGATPEPPDHPVDRRFAWLHGLDAGRSGAPAEALGGALAALRDLGVTLETEAGTPAQAAALAAAAFGNGGAFGDALADVRRALDRFDRRTRAVLFEAPIRNAWAATLEAARRHVDARWQAEVCRPFETGLAGRFPVDPSAATDVPLAAFEAVFAPQQGAVARFRAGVLEPFLEPGTLRPRTWEGAGLPLSPAGTEALRRAGRIGDALFNGDVAQFAFDVQAEQPRADSAASPPSQVYLDVHGHALAYDMGSYRPWTPVGWPGAPEALVRVTTREGDRPPLRRDGEWAWVRLLQAATSLQRRSATEYDVHWPVAAGLTARYRLRTPTAGLPLHDTERFFRFSCPPRLSP
jgi:type VI secretion system protein ImpL